MQIVFAEVSICPETIEMRQKTLRETHFEATATCFEYSMESQGFLRGTPRGPLGNPFGIVAQHWEPYGTVSGSQKAYFPKTSTNRRGERFQAPCGRFEVLARAPRKPVFKRPLDVLKFWDFRVTRMNSVKLDSCLVSRAYL